MITQQNAGNMAPGTIRPLATPANFVLGRRMRLDRTWLLDWAYLGLLLLAAAGTAATQSRAKAHGCKLASSLVCAPARPFPTLTLVSVPARRPANTPYSCSATALPTLAAGAFVRSPSSTEVPSFDGWVEPTRNSYSSAYAHQTHTNLEQLNEGMRGWSLMKSHP